MPHRLLYLVRHGAYDSEPADPVDGGSLNDAGREQVSLLADRLAKISFQAIHHSTAPRAVQTADLLAFVLADIPRHADSGLRECIPTLPDESELTAGQREFFAQLPAEARETGPQRATEALRRYTTVTEDACELVVSHGNLINHFAAQAMDAPAHGWLRLLDYHTGVTVIRYSHDGPPKLILYNDVGHLPLELRGLEYPAELRV